MQLRLIFLTTSTIMCLYKDPTITEMEARGLQ